MAMPDHAFGISLQNIKSALHTTIRDSRSIILQNLHRKYAAYPAVRLKKRCTGRIFYRIFALVSFIIVIIQFFSYLCNCYDILCHTQTYLKSVFALSFNRKSPIFQTQESSQKTLMLVAYPLPRQGVSISDKAWERTDVAF